MRRISSLAIVVVLFTAFAVLVQGALPAVTTSTWSPAGALSTPRNGAAAVLLGLSNYTTDAVTVMAWTPSLPSVTLSSDNCTGKTLAVNATCYITLSFAPTTLGAQSGTLAMSSTAGTNPSATITGTGVVIK